MPHVRTELLQQQVLLSSQRVQLRGDALLGRAAAAAATASARGYGTVRHAGVIVDVDVFVRIGGVGRSTNFVLGGRGSSLAGK